MAETEYTAYDALHTNAVGLETGLYVCKQTDVLKPSNKLESGKLSSVSTATWKLLGNVSETSVSHDIKTEEAEFYDEGGSNSHSKVTKAIALADFVDVTLVNMTPLFEAMVMGVPDPFGTDCGVGQEVPIFATSEMYADLCFKLVKKEGRNLYKTDYFYGRMHIPDAMTYNGSFQKPKVRIDVQRCAEPTNATSISTALFTGQTVVTGDGGGGGAVS